MAIYEFYIEHRTLTAYKLYGGGGCTQYSHNDRDMFY